MLLLQRTYSQWIEYTDIKHDHFWSYTQQCNTASNVSSGRWQQCDQKYYDKKSFDNRQRHNLFEKTPNKDMGYLDLSAWSEYYDIVVSTIDSGLQRHMDYKNDNHTN